MIMEMKFSKEINPTFLWTGISPIKINYIISFRIVF